jgi:hypothetical protein
MNIFESVYREIAWLFIRTIDWALHNWAATMALLILLIYWAGRQRRLNRHHL